MCARVKDIVYLRAFCVVIKLLQSWQHSNVVVMPLLYTIEYFHGDHNASCQEIHISVHYFLASMNKFSTA